MKKQGIILFILLISISGLKAQRSITDLAGVWHFRIDSTGVGIKELWAEKGLPQENTLVTVPHTWNVMPGLEGYWGKAWYERSIDVPQSMKKKIVRLQFDGVYHDATVWVNGKKAGGHYGVGYTQFTLDISQYLIPGKSNRITVCADNSASRAAVPFMKSFDWAHDGGIYRGVRIIFTEPQYIERLEVRGIPDLAVQGKGKVAISLIVPSSLLNSKIIQVNAEIWEENQPTQNMVFSGPLKISASQTLNAELNLDGIKLWHFDHPNLYKIKVSLGFNGQISDEIQTVFGFRTFGIQNERFVLNGEPVRLGGIEWMPGSSLEHGMAETHEEIQKNLELMKGMNCVYTRFHWPQDEFVLDWCDRNGILAQEEIPYWGWSTEFNDTTIALGYQYLDEMMAAHFNHPSLISWGVGNELRAHDPFFIKTIRSLVEYAKSKDPDRLANYVTNALNWDKRDNPNLPPDASSQGDMLCWNEYTPSWYEQPIENTLGNIEYVRKEYPNRPVVISEFGLCEPAFPGGDERRIRDVQYQIPTYGSVPYVAGFIYFCLNDYRTHMGEDHSYSYPPTGTWNCGYQSE
ncbi:MAG: hypothetical protein IPH88_10570 [Bacteroidales bacterium]|nr:hypothetical protein [Bacteroidales bacterium]